mmetsp:Transcript_4688/g.10940  ORF Transcript_4688/g.10940 Transcript_4688/m.10940 type:complete len:166 (+) Transcript_4688:441-938(+)
MGIPAVVRTRSRMTGDDFLTAFARSRVEMGLLVHGATAFSSTHQIAESLSGTLRAGKKLLAADPALAAAAAETEVPFRAGSAAATGVVIAAAIGVVSGAVARVGSVAAMGAGKAAATGAANEAPIDLEVRSGTASRAPEAAPKASVARHLMARGRVQRGLRAWSL